MEEPRFVSSTQVRNVLVYESLIPIVEKALMAFSLKDNTVYQPLRSIIPIPECMGNLATMACYMTSGALAVKCVTIFPNNTNKPTHNAFILLYSATDGSLLCTMDGNVITEMRTAAVSAVSAKYLAHPKSSKLCILGAGIQGFSHYKAITSLFHITSTRIFSRTRSHAEKLAEACMNGSVCDTVESAVMDADIIAVTLFTDIPVLFNDWIKPGCHIISIGAIGPSKQEIDPVLMRSSVLYVDSRESAMKETGDVIMSKAEIFAELGEVIAGSKEARVYETTVFKSLGLACEDAVSAKLVWDLLHQTL